MLANKLDFPRKSLLDSHTTDAGDDADDTEYTELPLTQTQPPIIETGDDAENSKFPISETQLTHSPITDLFSSELANTDDDTEANYIDAENSKLPVTETLPIQFLVTENFTKLTKTFPSIPEIHQYPLYPHIPYTSDFMKFPKYIRHTYPDDTPVNGPADPGHRIFVWDPGIKPQLFRVIPSF